MLKKGIDTSTLDTKQVVEPRSMAMMASGTSGDPFDDDHNVLDEDFLNDGRVQQISFKVSH